MGVFYSYGVGSTGIGIDFSLNYDIGFNYKVPYYSDRQYLVLGTDLNLHMASMNYLVLKLGIVKLTLNFELLAMKLVP